MRAVCRARFRAHDQGPALLTTLHESSRYASGSQSRATLRRVLLTVEVGLTVVLLTGAGLLLKSYDRLRSVGYGLRH